METEILEVREGAAGERAVSRAAALLRAGRLVAFPTETVYGLGALALEPGAVRGIFAAKERPAFNPLIVHVPSAAEARQVVAGWPDVAELLARAFWPGPLTFVLPRAAGVPDEITAGLPAVAVRAPAHPVAQRLLAAVGAPIAAPSANRYTTISPTTAEHVRKSLGGRIDAILDGGATPVGIESTVLDLTGPVPVLLRPGAVSRDEIAAVVGRVELRGEGPAEGAARPSPGLVKRHYAPDARVTLFAPGHLPGVPADARVGVIARHAQPLGVEVATWLHLPDEPAGFARQIYGALHALEDARVTDVFLEETPADPAWAGVRDRLQRAAG
ncbi:L-threonylcarbamoyladenylate synthase [Vulgatibacter sp.]|uniref:L-threonylcarbamoyladenylate synthase n=1 Tax=Vulgatibacter sp. TaxID=1971226 RepID=UPI0035658B34